MQHVRSGICEMLAAVNVLDKKDVMLEAGKGIVGGTNTLGPNTFYRVATNELDP